MVDLVAIGFALGTHGQSFYTRSMARFPPAFLDEIRLRLKASDIIGRTVKLKKEGREFRGLSPFTTEKTPSFFVNDEKARYFDFSSGKSGDIIGFLMETQSLSFPEAVRQLADLAGLEIPKETPEDAERAARAKGLAEACLEAAKFFRAMLSRADGARASSYLDRRGVSAQARQIFGIGFAPPSRTALKDYLLNKEYPVHVLVEAGLLIRPDDGGAPYDRFRNRIMFPIFGSRGRVIAFGGRALDKDARAKYLNSPETPLFHKSRTLYNLDRARRVSNKTKRPIIVAEGYLDVVAIDRAGWPAVAPLGTALTEQQLHLLWQSEDTPILCFDGDRAGRAAAWRAIDRAMPLLKPGKSLNFAFLPDGQDPDDLLREQGTPAFERVIDEAHPLADTVWQRHIETNARETPEQQAAFRQSLRQLLGEIASTDVRRAYGTFLAEKLVALEGNTAALEPAPPVPQSAPHPSPSPQQHWRDRQAAPPVHASDALKASLRPRESAVDTQREAVIAVTLFHHPELFLRQEDTALEVELRDKALAGFYMAIIDALAAAPDLDTAGLRSHMLVNSEHRQVYDRWATHPMIRVARFARVDANIEDAERGWLDAIAIGKHHRDLGSEVAEAAAEAHLDPGRERIWRDAVRHRASYKAQHRTSDSD